MPELPDLQAFCRNLSKTLSGRKIEKLHAVYPKKMNVTGAALAKALKGATLESIIRDGKELHFAFNNGNVLAIHLMLRGQLHYVHESIPGKSTILELFFDSGPGLMMTDIMKQARVTLNPPDPEVPDVLSDEVDYNFFKQHLGNSRSTIKKLLTDQKAIRGIGNAYADEILWQAGISPFSISSKIPDDAIRNLLRSIKKVFADAERKILEAQPDIIGGEIRDFLIIHNPNRAHSPTGAEILLDESGGRKTYYTREQQLWS